MATTVASSLSSDGWTHLVDRLALLPDPDQRTDAHVPVEEVVQREYLREHTQEATLCAREVAPTEQLDRCDAAVHSQGDGDVIVFSSCVLE